ncbi:MAG: hypothetical protein ACYSWP_22990 [Planctomycetota bacterium]|jgi:hypothetical protein
MFRRRFDDKRIEALRGQRLFTEHLLPDITDGKVFPAIRNNTIDFYHKGGRLFSFDGNFKTHHKFASIFKWKDDIYENDLSNVEVIRNFCDGYKQIKERCALFSKTESKGVSK